MINLSNIPLKRMEEIIVKFGYVRIRTKGGHSIWSKDEASRPIVLQTHKDPVPRMVVFNTIRDLGITKDEFLKVLNH